MAFIVIEGLDGAGKSTQIRLLTEYFSKRGIKSKYLHFPRMDSPFFGEMIARFLRGELGDVNQVDPYVVALLYACDRMDASKMIKDWLENGETVILDRYVYSNVGFQCAKVNDEAEQDRLRKWIIDLEFGYYKIPQPDLNLFLDVPFQFTKERLTEIREGDDREYLKGKEDIHEKDLSFQERVRQIYLKQKEIDSNFKIVECYNEDLSIKKPEEIFNLIIERVEGIV
ncbi:MAG: dTMP kinase [Bacteroidales bacterium]|nr:dTMP kinase [Bacteroidales bacterium]